MKRLVILATVLVSACAVKTVPVGTATPSAPAVQSRRAALAPQRLSPTDVLSAQWDYVNTELSKVERFELQVDNGGWLSLGKPPALTQGDPISTYKAAIGVYSVGTHTAILRACNSLAVPPCSEAPPVSFTVDAPPTPTTPPAPSNLRITGVTVDTVALAWDDNSGNETSFEVDRDGARVATVAANITQANVTGLVPAMSYTFRARAVNDVGASPYTAETVGTTLPPPDAILPTVKILSVRQNGNSPNHTVTASATDDVGVRSIVFLLDGKVASTQTLTAPQTTGTYTATVKISTYGDHTITAQASDVARNTGVSTPWPVRR